MTVEEIKKAVDDGKTVHWASDIYNVIKDDIGQYLIKCELNDHCIGLTWLDGVTMNGAEDEFFLAPECNTKIYTLEDMRNSI